MPHTINGIGTWYYGKVGSHVRRGSCEHCGAFAPLASYDTTLFFVFFFVPIVPLRKIRVLEECRSCKRHSYLSGREWNAKKASAYEECLKAMDSDPGNVEIAEALVINIAQFQDEAAFDQHLDRLQRVLRTSAEGLSILAGGYSTFGRRRDAEQALRDAIALEDSPELREALAVNLAFQLRAEEARGFLDHVFSEADPEKANLIGLLVESAQGSGKHAFALQLVAELEAAFPDYEVSELRATSSRSAEGSKIRNVAFAAPPKSEDAPKRALLAKLAGPLLFLAAALLFCLSAFEEGQARPVYLLNGLRKPYTVEVNGVRHLLAPDKVTLIKLAEGPVEVRAIKGEVQVPSQTLSVSTPFWSRPFTEETIVINPDGCGLLLTQLAMFSEGGGGTNPPPVLHAGEHLYQFEDLDYVFAEFPQTVQIEKGSTATRRRLSIATGEANFLRAGWVRSYLGEEPCNLWLERELELDPDQQTLLNGYCGLVSSKRSLSFLRRGLAVRPVRIDWHRVYQGLYNQDSKELEREYRALLAEGPEVSEHLYLLGRILEDPAEAERLFEQATQGPSPTPYGHLALGYALMARGDFKPALERFRQAIALADREAFRAQEREALFGLERYEELLAEARQSWQKQPAALHLADSLIRLEVLSGQSSAATLTIERCVKAQGPISPADSATLRARLGRALHYTKGDLSAYAQACDETLAFRSAVARRSLKEASAAYEDSERGNLLSALTLLVLAGLTEDSEARIKALGCLDEAKNSTWSSPESRRLTKALLEGGELDHEALRGLSVSMEVKRPFLIALGQRYPNERDRYFALARKLNFSPEFPQQLFKEALAAE